MMNRFFSALNIPVFLIIVFSSCNFINPDEDIPAYIKVDTFSLTTDFATEGTSSHKITDVWVYVDNNVVGVYELPATIALLENGNHSITLWPGILVNGIAATRDNYPFYNFSESTVQLNEGEIISFHPATTYIDNAEFVVKESFDDAGFEFESTSLSDTILMLETLPANVFQLPGCAKVVLTDTDLRLDVATVNKYALPKSGSAIYLELNYRTNIEFSVGVIPFKSGVQQSYIPALTIREKDTWNKIYVNLTPSVVSASGSNEFKIYMNASKSTALSQAELFFDNLKVITF